MRKRLRLVLLFAALIGFWLAWFNIKGNQSNTERERVSLDLRRRTESLEKQRTKTEALYNEAEGNSHLQAQRRDELNGIDGLLKDNQQQIDAEER